MMRCVVLAVVVSSARALPRDSKDALKYIATGYDHATLLQTAAQKTLRLTEPHKHYNYTCEQCYRMTYSLQGMCKDTNGKSLHDEEHFQNVCVDDVLPVSFGEGVSVRKGKCSLFYTFVKELYCPYDPCTQITIQANKAHKAVCGLLRCQDPEDPLPPPPPAIPYDAPLTCPVYLDAILGMCTQLTQLENPSADQLCVNFNTNFTDQGCKVVHERMEAAVTPMRLCDSWSCDPPSLSLAQICEQVLKLGSTGPVRVPEYMYMLSQLPPSAEFGNVNASKAPVPVKALGINITRATLGYGENCFKDHTNNILLRSRAQCQGVAFCTFDNPNVVNPKILHDSESACEGNFAIEFTCVPGGRKHTVFGPHTATYASLTLDCVSEVKEARAFPSPREDLAEFNPDTFKDFDIYMGTRRRENAFMTPQLQSQRDIHHLPTTP